MPVLEFKNKVVNVDTQLDLKLMKETPAIMYKCNLCYFYFLANFRERDLEKFLPPYFKKTKNNLKMSTHALAAFLDPDSQNCILDSSNPDFYFPETDFIEEFQRYCKSRNFNAKQWSSDYYSSIFNAFGLKIVLDTKEWPPLSKNFSKRKYILGVRVNDEKFGAH